MKLLTKLLLSILTAAMFFSLVSTVMPTDSASAAAYCSDRNGWNKINKLNSWDSGPYYAGDTINAGVSLSRGNWPSRAGYYVARPSTYYATATMGNSGYYSFTNRITIYSYRNNGTLSASCDANITWQEYVERQYPVTPTVSVSYSGTGFHDTTTVNVSVSDGASGTAGFIINGSKTIVVNITNGYGSATIPWNDTYFKAKSASWDSYSGMIIREQFGTNLGTNGIFRPNDTRVFNTATFSPPQLVIGEETGNGTVNTGSNPAINGLSRSGWSNVSCNPTCSFSSGGGAGARASWSNTFNPNAGGTQKFGNDAATKTKTTIVPLRSYFNGDSTGGQSTSASFAQGVIYCYPESTSVGVAFYDYGQANYDSGQYSIMKNQRQYYYNMGPMRTSNPGEGFTALLTTMGGPRASDGWDTIVPRPSGGINWGGGWACNYPSAAAWITPSINFSLKSDKISADFNQHVKNLTVSKPGDPGRAIEANNVRIVVNGTVTRTVNCTSNASTTTCKDVALSNLPEGEYTVYAEWSGDRVFTYGRSATQSFTVYQPFQCLFPNSSKNIGITDSNGNFYTGDATIVKGNTPLKLTLPNVEQSDIKGMINWDSPPAGYSNIIGQTGITSNSSPGTGVSGSSEVKLFWDSTGKREIRRPALSVSLPMANGSSGGLSDSWTQGDYSAENAWSDGQPEPAKTDQYISFFWPSKEIGRNADGSPKRSTAQIVRYLQVYGTAFDFGTETPRTGWHSCASSAKNSGNPVSGKLTIVSGQLK